MTSEANGVEIMELGRILKENLFLFLLDLEVKRARRYQNFLSLLVMTLVRSKPDGNGDGLKVCQKLLSGLLTEEMRETDIIGSFGKEKFAVLLPYADNAAGNLTKSRIENVLMDFDFRKEGCEVTIEQISFPRNGTSTIDLIKGTLREEKS